VILKLELWRFKRLGEASGSRGGTFFGGHKMSSKATILIVFAWVMEVVGITTGMVNSTYTTFGDDLPNTLAGYIPAVPMVALAVAELGRVPLASAIYQKHKLIQGIAISASWPWVMSPWRTGRSASIASSIFG
jgi:hypothetical protein